MSVEEMAESIRAQGLISRLIVHVDEKRLDKRGVMAGETHRLAIGLLIRQEFFPRNVAVPCTLREIAEATGISLDENDKREDMHPADRCAAFRKLVEEGATEEDLSTRHALPIAEVRRILRIAGVHETLLAAFRAGRMAFESVLAYAATPDTATQLAVFKKLGGNPACAAWQIKNEMSEGREDSDSSMTKFVGLGKYRKAGGGIEEDQFGGATRLLDVALLVKLCEEKLAKLARPCEKEGWKWVRAGVRGSFEDLNLYDHAFKVRRDVELEVPKEVTERMAAIETQLEALDEATYDDEKQEREGYRQERALDEEWQKLQGRIDTEFTIFGD